MLLSTLRLPGCASSRLIQTLPHHHITTPRARRFLGDLLPVRPHRPLLLLLHRLLLFRSRIVGWARSLTLLLLPSMGIIISNNIPSWRVILLLRECSRGEIIFLPNIRWLHQYTPILLVVPADLSFLRRQSLFRQDSPSRRRKGVLSTRLWGEILPVIPVFFRNRFGRFRKGLLTPRG